MSELPGIPKSKIARLEQVKEAMVVVDEKKNEMLIAQANVAIAEAEMTKLVNAIKKDYKLPYTKPFNVDELITAEEENISKTRKGNDK